MTETIRLGRLGLEDLKVGRGKFEVTLLDGSVVSLSEVPLGRFIGDFGGNIEASAAIFPGFFISYLKFLNSSATSVTNITRGVDGQILFLRLDAQTTIVDEAGGTGQISLMDGRTFTGINNQMILLFYDGPTKTWRQIDGRHFIWPNPISISDSSGELVHAFGTTTANPGEGHGSEVGEGGEGLCTPILSVNEGWDNLACDPVLVVNETWET